MSARAGVDGWRQGRWAWLFAACLLPGITAVALLSWAFPLGWDPASPGSAPAGWAAALLVLASTLAFVWSALWDGPDGFTGRTVWAVVLVAAFVALIRRGMRHPDQEQSMRIRLAGHGCTLTVTMHLCEEDPAPFVCAEQSVRIDPPQPWGRLLLGH